MLAFAAQTRVEMRVRFIAKAVVRDGQTRSSVIGGGDGLTGEHRSEGRGHRVMFANRATAKLPRLVSLI